MMRTDPNYVDHNMSFATMLFFGEACNGDLFGLGRGSGLYVYAWDHEDDSRRCIASGLKNYFRGVARRRGDALNVTRPGGRPSAHNLTVS